MQQLRQISRKAWPSHLSPASPWPPLALCPQHSPQCTMRCSTLCLIAHLSSRPSESLATSAWSSPMRTTKAAKAATSLGRSAGSVRMQRRSTVWDTWRGGAGRGGAGRAREAGGQGGGEWRCKFSHEEPRAVRAGAPRQAPGGRRPSAGGARALSPPACARPARLAHGRLRVDRVPRQVLADGALRPVLRHHKGHALRGGGAADGREGERAGEQAEEEGRRAPRAEGACGARRANCARTPAPLSRAMPFRPPARPPTCRAMTKTGRAPRRSRAAASLVLRAGGRGQPVGNAAGVQQAGSGGGGAQAHRLDGSERHAAPSTASSPLTSSCCLSGG